MKIIKLTVLEPVFGQWEKTSRRCTEDSGGGMRNATKGQGLAELLRETSWCIP